MECLAATWLSPRRAQCHCESPPGGGALSSIPGDVHSDKDPDQQLPVTPRHLPIPVAAMNSASPQKPWRPRQPRATPAADVVRSRLGASDSDLQVIRVQDSGPSLTQYPRRPLPTQAGRQSIQSLQDVPGPASSRLSSGVCSRVRVFGLHCDRSGPGPGRAVY